MSIELKNIHHYFVDEAGDLTFFDRKGNIIIGNEGVSRFFMVGVAYITEPKLLHAEMELLRKRILADPYYKNVPSLQLSQKKTAVCFHAKDDLPEIRREVFQLLQNYKIKVQVAIRRKNNIARNAQETFIMFGQKLETNQIYDDLVKRLFKNLLHKSDGNEITFARRGKSLREDSLKAAILKAQKNYLTRRDVVFHPTNITACYPSESTGLQVIDYYLWALQRLYEKGEDRFFSAIAKDFRLIMDLDDTRNAKYGEWYSDANVLTIEKIMPDVG